MFYQVIRIFFKGDKKAHSVEYFDDYFSAQRRYYSVIASDIGSDEINYSAAYIVDSTGLMLNGQVFDRRVTPIPEDK